LNHQCVNVEELEAVRALPAGDSRRLDVETCPRCRAMLNAYVEFLEDRSIPAGVDHERAAMRLAQAFERALLESLATPLERSTHANARRPERVPTARAWWMPLLGARAGWAVAAVLVIALGFYAGARWRAPMTGAEDVLRATPDSLMSAQRRVPLLQEPRPTPSGIELHWTTVAGADAYRVVFLNADLEEIASAGPGPDTTFVLVAGSLPSGLAAGRAYGWEVEALQGGFSLSRSTTSVVNVP
jgi:hypothetical protein